MWVGEGAWLSAWACRWLGAQGQGRRKVTADRSRFSHAVLAHNWPGRGHVCGRCSQWYRCQGWQIRRILTFLLFTYFGGHSSIVFQPDVCVKCEILECVAIYFLTLVLIALTRFRKHLCVLVYIAYLSFVSLELTYTNIFFTF